MIGDVHMTGSGFKEMKRGMKSDATKAKLIPRVTEILATGRYDGRTAPHKQRADGFTAFHFFEKDVEVGDSIITAGVNVGEREGKQYEFNLSAYGLGYEDLPNWHKNKDPLSLPGNEPGADGPSKSGVATTLDATLANNGAEVNEGLNIVILKVIDKATGKRLFALEDDVGQEGHERVAPDAGTVNYYDASAYVVEHFLDGKDSDAMVFSMIDGGKLIQSMALKNTKAGVTRAMNRLSVEASTQNPDSDVTVSVFRTGDNDNAAKFLTAKGFTIDYTPKQDQQAAAPAEDKSASEQPLIDAYIRAFGEAAAALNAAVAAVNWDGITDIATARAENDKLTVASRTGQYDIIGKASKTLESIGIKTWDKRIISGLRDEPGTAAWSAAIDSASSARDRIQAIAKERLIVAGTAEVAALPVDAPLADVAAAIFHKAGLDFGTQTPKIVAAIEAKDAALAWNTLGNLDNKASTEIFERATGIKLAKTQRDRRPQIDEWAGITPEQRAELDAQRTEAQNAKDREDVLKWAWDGLGALNVRSPDSNVQNGQELLKSLFAQGFDEVITRKHGAATGYYVRNAAGHITSVKSKNFTGFLKATLAFGGLRQALEHLGVIEPKIELTGKELGDFPDTEEGKKELRKAAKSFLMGMRGEQVDCPILGMPVEIRKRGVDETIAFSANPKKLKLIPAIKSIIKTASEKTWQDNVKKGEKPHVAGYYLLKSGAKLEGEELAIDVLIEKDENGLLHYDLLVERTQTKAALDSSSAAPVSKGSQDNNSWHLDNSSIGEPQEDFNEDDSMVDENEIGETFDAEEVAMDSASGGGMVFNLFIEGEEEVGNGEGERQPEAQSPLAAPEVISPASADSPAEDPQKTADIALFQSIIDNTVPDILDASYIDQLEAAYMRHIGNAEMEALFVSAVNAYTAAELAASANI